MNGTFIYSLSLPQFAKGQIQPRYTERFWNSRSHNASKLLKPSSLVSTTAAEGDTVTRFYFSCSVEKERILAFFFSSTAYGGKMKALRSNTVPDRKNVRGRKIWTFSILSILCPVFPSNTRYMKRFAWLPASTWNIRTTVAQQEWRIERFWPDRSLVMLYKLHSWGFVKLMKSITVICRCKHS